MGTYINPGNDGFSRIIRGEYVDKTSLIGKVNKTIGTTKNLICVSRPRRFGKSFAAQMLCAYYDMSCDSHGLFDGFAISGEDSYEEHINKYHVISLDITGFISAQNEMGGSIGDLPAYISKVLLDDVCSEYPDLGSYDNLSDALRALVSMTGRKIFFIIDEWDAIIRESDDDDLKKRYLYLLRGWFKNGNFTPSVVVGAYMTGILPIKKDGSQSAISDFTEYSMLDPRGFAEYVGFTEDEVQKLCSKYDIDYSRMKTWYDGYNVGDTGSVYNPYPVMQVVETGKFDSYWKKTTAAETLMTYIDMDEDGLQKDIARLVAGESLEVDVDSFENDVETFTCKDDVLTLLIHLGYLTYSNIDTSYDGSGAMGHYVHIPNEEVRTEFRNILRKTKHKELINLVKRSDKLLEETLEGNCSAVAKAVAEVHDSECAPTFYNDEQSLRYVVKLAYITCVDQYEKIEELPSGRGIADIVFLPKRRSHLPAMVIELKWNKSADGALSQIINKKYSDLPEKYAGEVVLVGINYDEKSKEHTCIIEKSSTDT